MQPVVHATTRTPGPSTAEPVVNECRNPMSPDWRAARTVCSGTPVPSFTRSSNGLFAASSGVCVAGGGSGIGAAVERAVHDVHLLLAAETDEVDRVPRHANRQTRVFFGVLHRVEQHLAVEHVDVHVEA